jgi:hypothetical protein
MYYAKKYQRIMTEWYLFRRLRNCKVTVSPNLNESFQSRVANPTVISGRGSFFGSSQITEAFCTFLYFPVFTGVQYSFLFDCEVSNDKGTFVVCRAPRGSLDHLFKQSKREIEKLGRESDQERGAHRKRENHFAILFKVLLISN